MAPDFETYIFSKYKMSESDQALMVPLCVHNYNLITF